MLKSNTFFNYVLFLTLVTLFFELGRHVGFVDGANSIEYDRANAQRMINDCHELVGKK